MKTQLLELLTHLITKAASDGKEEVRLALLELRERVQGMEDEAERLREALKKLAAARSTWTQDKIESHRQSDNHGDIAQAAVEEFSNAVADLAEKALKKP